MSSPNQPSSSLRFLHVVRNIQTETPAQKSVLMALTTRADRNGKSYPNYFELMYDTGLSYDSVRSCLKYLRDELRVVTWVQGHSNQYFAKPRANSYTLVYTRMKELSDKGAEAYPAFETEQEGKRKRFAKANHKPQQNDGAEADLRVAEADSPCAEADLSRAEADLPRAEAYSPPPTAHGVTAHGISTHGTTAQASTREHAALCPPLDRDSRPPTSEPIPAEAAENNALPSVPDGLQVSDLEDGWHPDFGRVPTDWIDRVTHMAIVEVPPEAEEYS